MHFFQNIKLTSKPKKFRHYPLFFLVGLSSLVWFVIRTGKKPTRFVYPCQKIAAANSLLFLSWLASVFGLQLFLKQFRKQLSWKRVGLVIVLVGLTYTGYRFIKIKITNFQVSQIRGQTGSARVVWVHDTNATNWNYSNTYYGDYVDQNTVNNMTDQGLKALTGTNNITDAWKAIIPNYQLGQKIAIKINLNNTDGSCTTSCHTNCQDWQLRIDALIQPVNALVRGLSTAFPGFNPQDVWVYDATSGTNLAVPPHVVPERLMVKSLYSIKFFGGATCTFPTYPNYSTVTFNNTDPTAVSVSHRITDQVVNANYLINMPIIKKHGGFDVTLAFKNHFGSVQNTADFHWNKSIPDDLYDNPHFKDKTVLIVGDGLFGGRLDNYSKPTPWTGLFGGDAPNSLFFSKDPVAIDSVMVDVLEAESGPITNLAYLSEAHARGLGTCEWNSSTAKCDRKSPELALTGGNPGYQQINFVYCENGVCPGTEPVSSVSPSASPQVSPSSSIAPSPSPSPSIQPSPSLAAKTGDLDNNGFVNIQDVLLMFRALVNKTTGLADINQDGKINSQDFVTLFKNWGS